MQILIVLFVLWSGVAFGRLLRRCSPLRVAPAAARLTARATPLCVWLLLGLMGCEVAHHPALRHSLGRLWAEAAWLVVGSTLMCGLLCLLCARRRLLPALPAEAEGSPAETDGRRSVATRVAHSLAPLMAFAVGFGVGWAGLTPAPPATGSLVLLAVLMGLIGLGLGLTEGLWQLLRHTQLRLFALPLLTLIGTWGGVVLAGAWLDLRPWSDSLAIGSGLGYYSLSSVLITEARGAEAGTVALLYNVLREVLTLVAAPWLARWFGPLAPISSGGATTADTTLPVIAQASGQAYVPLAIAHGLALDLSVPLLVAFCCAL